MTMKTYNYPQDKAALQGVKHLRGNLHISGIGGYVITAGADNWHLHGLEELVSISGHLRIERNPGLQSLRGLRKLRSVDYIIISKNPRLRTLEGLENLWTVDSLIRICRNDGLKSLRGLEGLKETSDVTIYENPILESFEGLQNLAVVGHLLISRNPRLRSLIEMRALKVIKGVFQTQGNSSMSSIQLRNLTDVGRVDVEVVQKVGGAQLSLLKQPLTLTPDKP